MKIKTRKMDYDKVIKLPRPAAKRPKKPNILFRTILNILSSGELKSCGFSYNEKRMELAGRGPYLVLMNHSSFIDLKIATRILYPKPTCIVCTSDGFVGKQWLMRSIGCFPTQKFVSDLSLIGDMRYALKNGSNVLMYPEASYSFDGTATPLPRKLGRVLKLLGVPVITIITKGAFLHDPLYNSLQLRKTKVTAEVTCLFTPEELESASAEQVQKALDEKFSFDNFRTQQAEGTVISAPFRADGLNRILYKCAACGTEGMMEGCGTTLRCRSCGKVYELTPTGRLEAKNGNTEFSHIPDWYRWQRDEVRSDIENGSYCLDTDVSIGMMVDYKAIYMVGDGRLKHTADGFELCGCDGRLRYTQSPVSSYSLYSDYYWYEIGDVICIGNRDCLYYCFPKCGGDVVAKTRLAAEEIYKIHMARRAAVK